MDTKEKDTSALPVFQVDFSKLQRDEWMNYIPSILVFNKLVFRLSSWPELLKIFYYLAYKSENGAPFFEALTNKNIVVDIMDDKNHYTVKQDLNVQGKPLFSDTARSAYSGVKFYKKIFVSCCQTVTRQTSLYLNKPILILSAIDNLEGICYAINNLGLQDVQIYLAKDVDADVVEQAQNSIISELTKKTHGKRRIEKNTKYFLAHINGEILSPEEKFYRRIGKEFDRKILLGDIVVSPQDEEDYLKPYMKNCLQDLVDNDRIPDYPKVFAVGLVRCAMKYYRKKTFWPYFKREYGVEVNVNDQFIIHKEFRDIMVCKDKKAYDDNASMKIDNISLHSFVTDYYADQFFDYLFSYWNNELQRNVENIYGENSKAYFDPLLEEIKTNKEQNVNGVMLHTSMALSYSEKSCSLRIRRILNMMHKCFWAQTTEIPQTGNRINDLLQKWMRKPNGKFLKESRTIDRKHTKRGEILLSSPQLVADLDRNEFLIKLPQEILRPCEDEECPYWEIVAENLPALKVEPTLCSGKIGNYTIECELSLPKQYLFKKLTIVLLSAKRQYARFSIKQSDIRFFNEKGLSADISKDYLPSGRYVVYSLTDAMPKFLDGDNIQCERLEELYVARYELNNGDILLLSNNHALPVGKQIKEGLVSVDPLDGVTALSEGVGYNVYNQLPNILFKAKREQLAGTAIVINEKRFRMTEIGYHEFKLDDTLEDIYAYFVDLKSYIQDDGIYSIRIDLPRSMEDRCYKFAYLKDFAYRFEEAPYIFRDNATIVVEPIDKIKIDRNWAGNSLQFNFDSESREVSDKVFDRDLKLNYSLHDRQIELSVRIPALFWKYKKEDCWHHKQPADVSLKHLPKHLYVCGPFDFKDKNNTHLNIDHFSMIDSDETDIYADKVKDENYYDFYLSNLKSWLDYSETKRSVDLTLDGKKYPLFTIICKSTIQSANLSGDYDNNTIHGFFEIEGDGEYTVKVEQDGLVIGQDIPLENGKFVLGTDHLGGTYLVTVYEIIADESGFDDPYSEKLDEYMLKLTDIMNLQNYEIELKGFQDSKRKYNPLKFKPSYKIDHLKYIGRYQDVKDYNILVWKRDFEKPEEWKGCAFYTGTLFHPEHGERKEDFNVLIIFYDCNNSNKLILLRDFDGEYIEMVYDFYTHTLIYDEEQLGLDKRQKKERLITLDDDLYDCIAEVKEIEAER